MTARDFSEANMEQRPTWGRAPDTFELGEAETHVWRVPLDVSSAVVEGLRGLLAPDERARAERFFFESGRRHFTVARAALRIILGRYLRREPRSLRFDYGPQGKPFLPEAGGTGAPLEFNLTHSHGLALVALTRAGRVGVDIEHIRPDFAGDEIAERFFSEAEVKALRSLPAEIRVERFFDCWTRKEAFIKARGEGLSLPLDQFDVTFSPSEPPCLLRTGWDADEAARWALHEILVGPDFKAALAVEGHGQRLKFWHADEAFLSRAF